MRLYDYIHATGYEIINPVDSGDFERFKRLRGKPVSKKWKPIRVERIRATPRQGCKPSDAPYMFCSGVLMLRRSAVDALRDILDAHGELLPLEDTEGVELYAYNPRALAAIDYAQSNGVRGSDGQLLSVRRHVFFPSVVEGIDIFRQAHERVSIIYLSERFLQRWKKAKLKGLDFYLVWDSGLPPDQQPNVMTAKPVKMSTIR